MASHPMADLLDDSDEEKIEKDLAQLPLSDKERNANPSDVDVTKSAPNLQRPLVLQSTPAMAAMALALTSQSWRDLGHGNDPSTAASSDLEVSVERIVSLFVIRVVAITANRRDQKHWGENKPPTFSNLSTTTICTAALKRGGPWRKPVTTALIDQVRLYIGRIFSQYKKVRYHNFEHAYHVVISANKLLDLMLCEEPVGGEPKNRNNKPRPTYGLKSDPLSLLALLFSAIVHDVEHQGIPNRQLVLESDSLALLYNDQSVAEQRSLAVAFSELMKDEFELLRSVIFESGDEYRRFRKTVINLVLTTDLASPERTQIVKSKWKEAFGETKSLERKEKFELSQRSGHRDSVGEGPASTFSVGARHTTPPIVVPCMTSHRKPKRRGSLAASVESFVSEVTMDPGHQHTGMHGEQDLLSDSLTDLNARNDSKLPVLLSRQRTTPSPTREEQESFSGPSADSKQPELSLQPSISPSVSDEDSAENVFLERTSSEDHPFHDSFATTMQSNLSGHKPKPLEMHEGDIEEDEIPMPVSPDLRRAHTDFDRRHRGDSDVASPERRSGGMCRRFSLDDMSIRRNSNVRIGIRRSLDITGEAIENYSVGAASFAISMHHRGDSQDGETEVDLDEPDELRATVVMEQMMKAADVSPNLQGWEHMEKWSSRLFFELMESFEAKRGDNPQTGWFENQITFIDSYTLPLARRLNDTGVFGNDTGSMFADIVLENKERWISEGVTLTSQMKTRWYDQHSRVDGSYQGKLGFAKPPKRGHRSSSY